jgi:hypothetical protein
LILIVPPQAQLQMEVLVKAGKTPIFVLNAPGFQGPRGTGTQGIGVNTPNAAVVAAATAGFAKEVHMAKGGMLTMGAKSIIVAAGSTLASTGTPLGMTIRLLGAVPKGIHCIVAPIQTNFGMAKFLVA